MNHTTSAQRHNARQDKIWDEAKRLKTQTRFNASSRHSPLPWNIGEDNDVFSANTDCVARVCGAPEGIKGDKANAKLIVRAVNHCERLGEALRGVRNWLEAGCDPSRKSLETAMMVLNEYERSKDQ